MSGLNIKTHSLLFAVLIIAVLTSVKFVHYGADAPERVTWSRSLFSDEACYAHNARNKVKYGYWNNDTLFYTVVSPVVNTLNYVAMKAAGVKYNNIRMVAVICYALTLFFLFLALRGYISNKFALLAVLLLGLNYSYFFYCRHILLEVPVIFFLILSMYFILKKQAPMSMFAAGIASVLAYMCKPMYIIWIPICVAALITGKNENKVNGKLIQAYLYGCLTLLLIYIVLFLFPLYNTITTMASEHLSVFYKEPSSILESINRFMHVLNTEFFIISPVLWLLSLLSIAELIKAIFNGSFKEKDLLERLAFFWLIIGIVFLMPWNYRPSRYYLHLAVPMCVLSVIFLKRLYEGEIALLLKENRSKIYSFVQLGIVSYIVIKCVRFYLLDIFYYRSMLHKVAIDSFVVIVCVGIFYFAKQLKKGVVSGKTAAAIILLVSLLFDVVPILQWIKSPQYTHKNVCADIAAIVPTGSTVAGAWAPGLCFEADLNIISLMSVKRQVSTNYFEKYKIDYLLLNDGKDELGLFKEKYPRIMDAAELITEYNIHKERVLLYKVKRVLLDSSLEKNSGWRNAEAHIRK